MDVEEALGVAIEKEIAAYQLYARTAERADDPALKSLLAEMAGQEDRHRELLQGIDPAQCGAFQPEERRDLKMAEYLEKRPLRADAGIQDVVLYAMHREQEAREFYAQMAESVADSEVAGLFRQLSSMENSHKARLEELYEAMFMRDN
jgi:rubrerythrin